MKDEFLRRLPADAKAERALIEAAFGIQNTIREKASAIHADGRLSNEAKSADIKAMVLGGPIGHLRQIRDSAAAMSADLANLKKSFAPKADHADLFGEMQRAELRAYMRSLPDEHARLRLAMTDDAAAEAAMLAHPALSGLTTTKPNDEDGMLAEIAERYAAGELKSKLVEDYGEEKTSMALAHQFEPRSNTFLSPYDHVEQSYRDRKFGRQLRGVEQREEVVGVLNDAIKTATGVLRRESGLTEAEIDAALN